MGTGSNKMRKWLLYIIIQSMVYILYIIYGIIVKFIQAVALPSMKEE